jgi:hypothetical protein
MGNRFLSHPANRQDARFRRVDHGGELLDVEHAQIRH